MSEPRPFKDYLREFQEEITPRRDTPSIEAIITREVADSYELACDASRLHLDRPARVESTMPNPFVDLYYFRSQQRLQEGAIGGGTGVPPQPSDRLKLSPENPLIQELAKRQRISPEQFVRNVQCYEAEVRKLYNG